ncbi:FAD/NAD(P)-binding protein [Polynucleobacter sp. 39-46-10]|uniref:FAD/NAD(P)-binding protein n=2 Tax=unclassified Polynucleobacter TaxID=2640945 RepID=UPI000BD6F598|nr:FAD/NAD(P)-binding protein [Polynucleobacter sp. 39-46-10]OZA75571.1 MAG: hypothetical protein B7X71_11275 [Polynucleobacter sp. 39-46-10]
MSNIKELAIIGDGFAAAVMVAHLLRRGIAPTAITVIGSGTLGKGNAYGCDNLHFRLNIRENLPIIFSDDPLHFSRWAKEHVNDPEAKTDAGYFYLRQDFGRYVSELISTESKPDDIEQIKAKVLSLSSADNSWNLVLDNQAVLSAKRVIIATGNPPPTWPCVVTNPYPNLSASCLVENPWTGHGLVGVEAHERIILLGGGLTALDAINNLVERKHLGQIYVISPRAIFPPAQANWERKIQPVWPQNLSPAKFIRFIRDYLPSTSTTSTEWQSAWEELRTNINIIWQQFSVHQKRTLFKRVGWLWNLYRFRASPQTIAAYEKLKSNNQIQFVLGRAIEIKCTDSKVRVLLGNGINVEGDRIINCTGVASDPLLNQLIENRLAIRDPLGHAIAVDASFRVIRSPSDRWNSLWMIGPATMGSLGDVIAASAIAKQAEQLAGQIAGG